MKIYFYPHKYLRDRQLDTVRSWPRAEVVNPEIAASRKGGQVSEKEANANVIKYSWKQKIPLLNLKRRPFGLAKNSIVYVWGGIISTGKFIIDLDNPWSIVGYNLSAMPLYRSVIKYVLGSRRCVAIRCMSNACRESLKILFGDYIYNKATVNYPHMRQYVSEVALNKSDRVNFLFVGTQFEIKGGEALLRAFQKVYKNNKNCQLDIVTHFPKKFMDLANCDGIFVHGANSTRDEIFKNYMSKADVLVLPTYVESFGMVALEALAHGLAIISTDLYALKEMVDNGKNGVLITPPLSIWNEYLPSSTYYNIQNIKDLTKNLDTESFESTLASEMTRFIEDRDWLLSARRNSIKIMSQKFSC